MPIYEYDCPECGRFETIQKFSDKPLTQCPKCKEAGRKSAVERAVSASAFHLKGSGWYKTDYASGSSGGTTASGSSKTNSGDSSGKSSSSESSSGASSEPAKSAGKSCGTGCGCH